MDKSVTKSVLGLQAPRIQQLPNITDQSIKLLTPDKFKEAQNCNICRQLHKNIKTKPLNCRVCGNLSCFQCSKKKINNQTVCDLCFLKQQLKKGQNIRKQTLRQKQATVKEIQQQIQQLQIKLQEMQANINKEQIQTNIILKHKSQELLQLQKNLRNRQQQLRSKQARNIKCKKQVQQQMNLLRQKQLRSQNQKSRISTLKLDISCKQKALMSKVEQYQLLTKQRQQLYKVIDQQKKKKN